MPIYDTSSDKVSMTHKVRPPSCISAIERHVFYFLFLDSKAKYAGGYLSHNPLVLVSFVLKLKLTNKRPCIGSILCVYLLRNTLYKEQFQL